MFYLKLYYERLLHATIGWTDEEFGAYVKLLIHQFDKGFLPKNEKDISRLVTSFKKSWPIIKPKFKENGGKLMNNMMNNVRKEAHAQSAKNKFNGYKGGRPKKPKPNPDETQTKPNGYYLETQTQTQLLDTDISNKLLNTINTEESTHAPEIVNNLNRQPKIPSYEDVCRALMSLKGTPEMAKSFFNKNEATGWFYKGTPIIKFKSLIPGFIESWKKIEGNGVSDHPEQKKMHY